MNPILYGPKISPGALALSILQAEGDQREDPPGSNRGKRIDVYIRSQGLDPAADKYAWCACAVSWAIREAFLRLAGLPKFRGHFRVSTMLEQNAALVIPVSEAQEGDVLVHIGEKGNHVGFFVKFGHPSIDPEKVFSHEGNTDEAGGRTGGRLMAKCRPVSYWTHAIRVA